MKPTEKQFADIVRQHKSTIYTVCYMFSKDEDEVADLFQDILVNMWRGLDSYRAECKLSTWIYRVSLNTCLSAERKRSRRGKRIPLSVDINLFEDDDSDSRQIRQLYNRIQRLVPVDRAIVLLWLDALSYEEIGEIVGISTKNVSVKLVRIREQLKQMNDEPTAKS